MSDKELRERVSRIYELLIKEYPGPRTELDYKDPLQLLVSTILSAQCTDKRVNEVTKKLFLKYKDAADYAGADLVELEADIKSTGFYRNKAKNIKGAAVMILEKFGGKVPDSMEELLTLPGVARKTANVVLGNAYGINEGIAVDTHVKRLSFLLGTTRETDPVKIEKDLMRIVPRDRWTDYSHLLILHGRRVCVARRPACERCVLNKICPSAFKV